MNKYIYMLVLFFFCTIVAYSQDYRAVDKHALKASKNISRDLPKLTNYLIHDYKTDLEKVRSFYTWIIHNIDYDKVAYKKGKRRINQSNYDILKRKKAVCFGYTTLFKEMCNNADIPCEMIYGYVKDQVTGVSDLTSANHAWNAVKINELWYVLDLTWGSGNGQALKDLYFLTKPEEFIFSHLPTDPMWQLLDCPIKPGIFRKEKAFVNASLQSSEPCFNFRDSIETFLKLPRIERRLKFAKNAYHFNPIVENEKELGHVYMDYVGVLNDRVEVLELTDSLETIKSIHLQIIAFCKEAERYTELYDRQKENLAYSHINYAIALSKELQQKKNPAKPVLEEMLDHFEIAKTILEDLPNNFLIENNLSQIEEYLKWIHDY